VTSALAYDFTLNRTLMVACKGQGDSAGIMGRFISDDGEISDFVDFSK
jgi:hypothetical protein